MTKIEINEHFQQALDLMENTNRTLFVTGEAGTGKSTLLKYFRETTNKNVTILAPTGIAALNVKGQTIHSFLNFPPHITKAQIRKKRPSKKLMDVLTHLDMIIIDEVSMVRADLLDCIDEALKTYLDSNEPFAGIQMVFIGDMYQLPPIVSGDDEKEMFRTFYQSPYFFDAKIFESIDMSLVELKKIYRQNDPEFIELLNKIRNSKLINADIDHLNSRHLPDDRSKEFRITLTTTNAAADSVNREQSSRLKTKTNKYSGEVSGDFENKNLPTSQELELKIGSQIMMLNNDAAGRWVNGSIGKIVNIKWDEMTDEDYLIVELENGKKVNVIRNKWELFQYVYDEKEGRLESEIIGSFKQYPLRLAWAVTIHKSQGKTFDNVAIDIGNGAFVQGQVYVAISRCTSFEGLVLKKPILRRHIWIDRRIVGFLKSFEREEY